MHKTFFIIVASILFLLIMVSNSSAIAAQSPAALRCGVDQNLPAQHFFADPDGQSGWKEYPGPEAISQLYGEGGVFARQWKGVDGKFLIRTEEPGEDFTAYTDYCFDRTGDLIQFRFELRTVWGWGYRKESPISNGLLASNESEYFSLKTDLPIAKPDDAENIPDALSPRLYMKQGQLPFSKLLAK